MTQIQQWGIDDIFKYDELEAFDIIEFCNSLDINLKGFVKEFKRVSSKIITSLDNDSLIDFVSYSQVDFYKEYTVDVNTRVKKLLKPIEYCLEYPQAF